MKRVVLALMIISFTYINAQESGWKLKGSGLGTHVGLSKVTIYNSEYAENGYQKSANGLQIGISYNLKIGPVGFAPELNVVNFKFNYDVETPGIDNSRYYVSLPLPFKWYLGPLNLYAGPQFSYLVGGRWDYDECVLDQCVYVEKGDEIEEVSLYRKFDISAIIGLGVDTKMGLYSSFRMAVSLVPIMNEELISHYENDDNMLNASYLGDFNRDNLDRYISAQLFVGYRF